MKIEEKQTFEVQADINRAIDRFQQSLKSKMDKIKLIRALHIALSPVKTVTDEDGIYIGRTLPDFTLQDAMNVLEGNEAPDPALQHLAYLWQDTEFINLTPHELNIERADGSFLVLPKSDIPARVAQSVEKIGEVSGIVVYRKVLEKEIENLPAPKEGIVYIVSALVLNALSGARPDVYAPGEGIRDAAGRIIGCKGLSQ